MGGPDVDILAVCTDLADACIAADDQLRASPTIKDAPTPPVVVVLPAAPFIDYERTMRHGVNFYFELTLVAGGRVAEVATMRRLYGWLNPRGALMTALNAVPGAAVKECSRVGYIPIGGQDYPGAVLTVHYVG
jgi:hypothetical protein